jgi:hypothetical protein
MARRAQAQAVLDDFIELADGQARHRASRLFGRRENWAFQSPLVDLREAPNGPKGSQLAPMDQNPAYDGF